MEENKLNNNKEEGMETIKQQVYRAICQYCGKEFRSLYQNQLANMIETHERNCKGNPSNNKNGKA